MSGRARSSTSKTKSGSKARVERGGSRRSTIVSGKSGKASTKAGKKGGTSVKRKGKLKSAKAKARAVSQQYSDDSSDEGNGDDIGDDPERAIFKVTSDGNLHARLSHKSPLSVAPPVWTPKSKSSQLTQSARPQSLMHSFTQDMYQIDHGNNRQRFSIDSEDGLSLAGDPRIDGLSPHSKELFSLLTQRSGGTASSPTSRSVVSPPPPSTSQTPLSHPMHGDDRAGSDHHDVHSHPGPARPRSHTFTAHRPSPLQVSVRAPHAHVGFDNDVTIFSPRGGTYHSDLGWFGKEGKGKEDGGVNSAEASPADLLGIPVAEGGQRRSSIAGPASRLTIAPVRHDLERHAMQPTGVAPGKPPPRPADSRGTAGSVKKTPGPELRALNLDSVHPSTEDFNIEQSAMELLGSSGGDSDRYGDYRTPRGGTRQLEDDEIERLRHAAMGSIYQMAALPPAEDGYNRPADFDGPQLRLQTAPRMSGRIERLELMFQLQVEKYQDLVGFIKGKAREKDAREQREGGRYTEVKRLEERATQLASSLQRANMATERLKQEIAKARQRISDLQSSTSAAEQRVTLNPRKRLKSIVEGMTSARGVRHDRIAKEVHALNILKQTLAGTADTGEFVRELGKIDPLTLDRWLRMLLTHTSMYGKLVSLNEACTQVLQRTDAAILSIGQSTKASLGCDRVSVFAYDPFQNVLYSYNDDNVEIRIPADIGLAGACFQMGQSFNIEDAYEDPRFNPEFDKKTGYRTKAILCCPIRGFGQPIGVIQIINRLDPPHEFDATHEQTLEGIAMNAGIYLMQAETYEEVQYASGNVPLLKAIADCYLGDIKVETAMESVVDEVLEVLQADRATVFLHDAERGELYSLNQTHTGLREIRVPSGSGVVGHCFQKGTILNISDAQNDSRFNNEIDRRTGYHTKTILCVPVRNESGAVIGVIQALNKGIRIMGVWEDEGDFGEGFDDDDVQEAIDTARLAAFKLEYARLFALSNKK